MVTKWAVVFCWVLVHLEVIVQTGLAVECPAAQLTPPPAALLELMNLIYLYIKVSKNVNSTEFRVDFIQS